MDVKIPRIFVIFRYFFLFFYIYTTTSIYKHIASPQREESNQAVLRTTVTFVLISVES